MSPGRFGIGTSDHLGKGLGSHEVRAKLSLLRQDTLLERPKYAIFLKLMSRYPIKV